MAFPTKGSATPATPTAPVKDEAAPEVNTSTAIAVRSDDWAKIMRFLDVQSSVLDSAVPREIYGVQAAARGEYKSLEPTISKYENADDMVEVEVELDGGTRQKTLMSLKALSPKTEDGDGPEDGKTSKGKEPVEASVQELTKLEDNGSSSEIVQQSNFSSTKEIQSSAAPSRDPTTPTPLKKKKTAKEKAVLSTQKSKPFGVTKGTSTPRPKTSAPKLSALHGLLNDIRTPTKAPRIDRVALANAQRAKTTGCKTPSDTKVSMNDNGNRVRPDTPNKVEVPALPRPSDSKTAKSQDQGVPTTITVTGSRIALEDKTNKRKPTTTPPQLKKPVIKRKTVTSDGRVVSVNGVAVGSKRQRTTEDSEATDRPTKKLLTKQTSKETKEGVSKPAVKTNVNASSSSKVAKKVTANPSTAIVDDAQTQHKTEESRSRLKAIPAASSVDQGKTGADSKPATTSNKDTASGDKSGAKTSGIVKKSSSITLEGSGALEEMRAVAKVVKKAPKTQDTIKDDIDDSTNEQKKKTKTAASSTAITCKDTKDTNIPKASDEDTPDVRPKRRIAKSRPLTNTAIQKAGTQKSQDTISAKKTNNTNVERRRKTPDDDDDIAGLIDENLSKGALMNEPRRKTATPHRHPTTSRSAPSRPSSALSRPSTVPTPASPAVPTSSDLPTGCGKKDVFA